MTQIPVQVIYMIECEQNCVLNTEPSCEDHIVAVLQEKIVVSSILPGITKAPKYRIHVNLSL